MCLAKPTVAVMLFQTTNGQMPPVDVEGCDQHNESYSSAPVAQLDRVPGYEPGGREFESHRARHMLIQSI